MTTATLPTDAEIRAHVNGLCTVNCRDEAHSRSVIACMDYCRADTAAQVATAAWMRACKVGTSTVSELDALYTAMRDASEAAYVAMHEWMQARTVASLGTVAVRA